VLIIPITSPGTCSRKSKPGSLTKEPSLPATAFVKGIVPSFSVNITNFEAVIPTEIKDKLQGYRLVIVKRKSGERLVEDISFLKQSVKNTQGLPGGSAVFETVANRYPDLSSTAHETTNIQFGRSRLRSNQVHIYRPDMPALVVKCNYALGETYTSSESFPDTEEVDLDDSSAAFGTNKFLTPDEQRFATIENIEYVPGNIQAADTLAVEEFVRLTAKNTLQGSDITGVTENRWNPLGFNVSGEDLILPKWNFNTGEYTDIDFGDDSDAMYNIGISATLLNLPKNINTGFNPVEFITIGRATDEENFYKDFTLGGDIFTNALQLIPVSIVVGVEGDGISITKSCNSNWVFFSFSFNNKIIPFSIKIISSSN